MQVDAAVAVFAPAMIYAPAEPYAAGVIVRRLRVESPFLETGYRVDNFESRAGRIDSLDDAICERMLRIGHQLAPCRRFHAAAKNVGVEGRMRDHREYVAIIWIERDESAVLAGHRLFGGLLQVEIDGHHDVLAGLVGNLLEHPEPPTDRVNLYLLTTCLPAPKTFAAPLEPEF